MKETVSELIHFVTPYPHVGIDREMRDGLIILLL
jgi:hypothetical protein